VLNLLIFCCIHNSIIFLINDYTYKEGKGGEGESFERLAGAGKERGELPYSSAVKRRFTQVCQLLSEDEKVILAEEEAALKDNKDCLIM